MKLKNRPSKYLKRSDLPGRASRVTRIVGDSFRKPKDLDFTNVEIDASFYFTWQNAPRSQKRR